MKTENLQEALARALAGQGIPGGQVGIIKGGTAKVAAAGVVAAGGSAPVTMDHKFNLGSISKLFTAHLIMARIARGDFALQTKITDLLPDFLTDDMEASRKLTVFHMLTHTSGLFGEHEPAPGAKESFYARAPQLTRPGEVFSYCNIGFSILGKVVEEATGLSWAQCVEREILEPIGMSETDLDPSTDDERWVCGHQPLPEGGRLKGGVRKKGPRFQAPSGATAITTARDVLRYAEHIMACARGDAKAPLLPGAVVREMWRKHVAATPNTDGWGLGWRRYLWGGLEVVGHDGSMPGHTSFLRLAPSKGVAIAVLCNHENGAALFDDVAQTLFAPLVGASPPKKPDSNAISALRLEDYAGAYSRPDTTFLFRDETGRLVGEVFAKDDNGEPWTAGGYVLSPVGADMFLARDPHDNHERPVSFMRDGDGAVRYVTAGLRTYVRDSGAPDATRAGARR